MALNITVEKVLKRSKRPNTALGIKPLPIAPIVIVNRAERAQTEREGIPDFLPDSAISTIERMDNTTTATVTIRCMMLPKEEELSPLIQGKSSYPT